MVLIALGLRPDPVIPGYLPSNARFVPPPDRSDRVARHARTFKEALFEANCASLVRIVRLLDDRDVRVLLLRTPFHPSYVAHRPRRWEDLCDAALGRLRAEAGMHHAVVSWDLMKHPNFRDDDFRDDDHLNTSGAARLGAILKGWIDPLLAEIDRESRLASTGRPLPQRR
jgi:hypothetical protein